jgi:hypothetical protein
MLFTAVLLRKGSRHLGVQVHKAVSQEMSKAA